jgi:hypothetical protein
MYEGETGPLVEEAEARDDEPREGVRSGMIGAGMSFGPMASD